MKENLWIQKIRNQFRRKLSTDLDKLRSFLPSGQAFISKSDLFFSIPTFSYDLVSKGKKIIPNWSNNDIYYYSLEYLKKTERTFSFSFLQYFRIYRSLAKIFKIQSKIQLIQTFLKWLKNNLKLSKNKFKFHKLEYIVKYFNFLFCIATVEEGI